MIMPENVPEAVERFLEVTRLTPSADLCISIAPNEGKRERRLTKGSRCLDFLPMAHIGIYF